MTLKEIYSKQNKTPAISFEIFPPKNDSDGSKLDKLMMHLDLLKKYQPDFISLTYGAGGTNQSLSLDIIKRIQNELSFNIMPHFTCVCSSKEKVGSYLKEIDNLGIKNILALRGDIPEGVDKNAFDFHYANELVEFIKSRTDLSIGVAGYPEGHMECPDLETDLKHLKNKVETGADAIFTQMFFDNSKFFKFCEKAQNLDINIPIIPGIMAITSYQQIDKMLSMARVTLPDSLIKLLDKYKDSSEDIKKIGIEFASKQCEELIPHVKGLHFYTLNTSSTVSKILDNLFRLVT